MFWRRCTTFWHPSFSPGLDWGLMGWSNSWLNSNSWLTRICNYKFVLWTKIIEHYPFYKVMLMLYYFENLRGPSRSYCCMVGIQLILNRSILTRTEPCRSVKTLPCPLQWTNCSVNTTNCIVSFPVFVRTHMCIHAHSCACLCIFNENMCPFLSVWMCVCVCLEHK